MASIKRIGNKFYVYFYHPVLTTESGKKKQVYEDFETEDAAKARKAEIEENFKRGDYSLASQMTVEDYFYLKFVPLHAQDKWKYKTWDTNMCYWKNDILPYFGKKRISKVTSSEFEKFMLLMKNTRARNMPKTPIEERPFLSETTLRYIYVLTNCFFKKAEEWEDIQKSPVKCKKPAVSTLPRKFWEPEQFEQALMKMNDDLLHLAIHLAFRCTLRLGELCAITWDDLEFGDRTVNIDKQMQRVTVESLRSKTKKEVFHTYPAQSKTSGSRLIITSPKSDYGVRVNKMSDQLCQELKQRQLNIVLEKARLGKRYQDNNLVFCLEDGRPLEPGRLSRRFAAWQKIWGLEAMGKFDSIDFHSIRISSTSLKLAVSGGDLKSAQSDLGDKTPHMVLSTYARRLQTHHQKMNDKFDEAFYGLDGVVPDPGLIMVANNELLVKAITNNLSQPEFLGELLQALQAQYARHSANA